MGISIEIECNIVEKFMSKIVEEDTEKTDISSFFLIAAYEADVYQYIRFEKIPEGQFYAGAVRKRRYLCTICPYVCFFKPAMVRHVFNQHIKCINGPVHHKLKVP